MFVIAGVTGHVGSVAAEKLLQEKQKVRVIVRSEDKGAKWAKMGAELAVGSLEDATFLSNALKGASGFFALIPPNFQVNDVFAWQCKTADTIASAVKTSGVPHVVILSSIGGELSEGTGPIKGLHYLEEAMKKTGAKVTALRPGFFQENIAGAVSAAKAVGFYPNFFTTDDMAVNMIATKDIGAAVANALKEPGQTSQTIDLQGPAYSAKQIAEKVGAAMGKPLPVVTIAPKDHVNTLVGAGVPPAWASVFAEMYAGYDKLKPNADKLISCLTPIDEVVRKVTA